MKTTNRLLILFAVVLLFFASSSCDQDPKTHTVTLYVNTAEITKDNINEFCYFIAESPGMDPIKSGPDLEEFTITVNVGDTIIWNGISSNSPDSDAVNIKKIKYEKGRNIFDKDSLIGNEKVVGKVRHSTFDKTNKKQDLYKYIIKFKVINNGVPLNRTFKIDPKIQVN